MKMTVKEVLNDILIHDGWTKTELANRIGYPNPSPLTKIFNETKYVRDSDITVNTLIKIMSAYGYDVVMLRHNDNTRGTDTNHASEFYFLEDSNSAANILRRADNFLASNSKGKSKPLPDIIRASKDPMTIEDLAMALAEKREREAENNERSKHIRASHTEPSSPAHSS